MKDDEIIALYLARNESAISATSDKYGSYCHSISYNILHDSEDAKECVNDTWLGAWKSIPPHRPNRLSTYLGKITRNLSLNRFRQYTAEKRGFGQTALVLSELDDCIPSGKDVEQVIEEMALTASINRFLRQQSRERRNIFIRRYWYLYPIRDIAIAYGMSESKVASLLFRMRNELKSHLEKEGITI
ncbi:MAG: sigma-70 family RNA polymerase sigma factor [Roseburia sp.]|nr:sigma-70 family RNA polymerase sigma factor [Roseburia sp.]MCM1098783.1 sigma-70 family RNA polymerase sigma factor [Ruminococcus flavefaciens]